MAGVPLCAGAAEHAEGTTPDETGEQDLESVLGGIAKPPPGIVAPAAEHASAPRSPRAIEEIVVTAQKREQALRDVPISMSVIDDEFMKEANIADFHDLAVHFPNVSVFTDNQTFYMDVRIRGFGSPIANKAFEQPVGLVIDGIPYGRLQYWQGPIFDLDRVEVLRGPQGTLFGKNTTAGLFNVTTRKPSDEFTASLAAGLTSFDGRRFEGGIGGPLVAGIVSFRLSGLSDEREGFMRNTTARVVPGIAEIMNGLDRKAVRAQLAFPDVAGAGLTIGYEHSESEATAVGFEIREVVERQVPFFLDWDPSSDFERFNRVGSIDAPAPTRADIDTVVANADYILSGWGLHAIAGYSILRSRIEFDSDFTPAPMIPGTDHDDSPHTTLELRVDSPSLAGWVGLEQLFGRSLGRSDFSAGFFFQDRGIRDAALAQSFNPAIVAQLLATDATGVAPPCPECEEALETITVFFDQTGTTIAGFGHLNWYLGDRWTVGYGMRFTQEEKEADWSARCTRGSCAGITAIFAAEEFSTSDSLSEFAFTPKVTLGFDWTEDVALYASWGEGFKSGGFNAAVFNDDQGLRFEPEKATSWELGAKTELFDGTARFDLALFHMEMTDLQVFTVEFAPPRPLSILVVNAGEARSRGIETDLTWLPTSWLTLRGSLGLVDAEFIEFPLGGCNVDAPDTDGNGDGRCDLSGRTPEHTPMWTSTVTPTLQVPLSAILPRTGGALPFPLDGLDLTGSLTVEYRDSYFVHQNLGRQQRQPSFIRLNASLGLGNRDQGWSLRVGAKNLTDTDVAARIQEVSVAGHSYAQLPELPRVVFGEVRWDF